MAQTPRKVPPARRQFPIETPASLLAEKGFEFLKEIKTENEAITKINAFYKESQEAEMTSVTKLLHAVAVIRYADLIGLIPPRKREAWIIQNTAFKTTSYARRAGRLFDERSFITDAIAFYVEQDGKRADTKWQYEVSRPSGIVYVEDCRKIHRIVRANPKASEAEKRAMIDEEFPMEREIDQSKLTSRTRRESGEALALTLIAMIKQTGTPKQKEMLARFASPKAFLEWCEDHVYSQAEDEAQATIRERALVMTSWDNVETMIGQAPSLFALPDAQHVEEQERELLRLGYDRSDLNEMSSDEKTEIIQHEASSWQEFFAQADSNIVLRGSGRDRKEAIADARTHKYKVKELTLTPAPNGGVMWDLTDQRLARFGATQLFNIVAAGNLDQARYDDLIERFPELRTN